MSLPPPDWINAKFLQKVLKKSTNDDSVEIKSIATKYATAKGDNYLSDIIRATVEYTYDNSGHKMTKNVSLIIKLALTTGDVQKMISELQVFGTEIKMMETTLMQMNEMLNEKNSRLSARVLYTEQDQTPLLVLEDLAPLGYRLADRQAGLDLDHSSLVMRKIAMFHASSIALWEKDPQLITSYKNGLYREKSPEDMVKIFKDGMQILGNQVLNWQELGASARSYSDKILKSSKDCYERATKIAKTKDGAFNVLIHGDLWVNNLLFRYDKDGKVDDIIFVDFQMSVWGSPALDLVYFLSNSISEDVELHHVDALLEEYLNVLTKTMSKLGCRTKSINMNELRRSLEEHEFLGVLSAAVGFPIILLDKSHALTFEEMSQMDGGYVSPIFKNPKFRRRMIRRLIAWDSRGVFDV